MIDTCIFLEYIIHKIVLGLLGSDSHPLVAGLRPGDTSFVKKYHRTNYLTLVSSELEPKKVLDKVS